MFSKKRAELLAEANALHSTDELWTNLNKKEYPSLPSSTAGAPQAPNIAAAAAAEAELSASDGEEDELDEEQHWAPLIAEHDKDVLAADAVLEADHNIVEAPIADENEKNTVLPATFTDVSIFGRKRKPSEKAASLNFSKK